LLAEEVEFWPKERVLAGGAGWLKKREPENTEAFPEF
jgi:hypothetical protein